MVKIDFHVHTHHSVDSLTKPRDLAAKSSKLGIVPAIADHNSIAAHSEMRTLGAPFIPAEEIATDRGDLVGLYISESIPKDTPFLEAIDRIHQQGGLAYLPHMYDLGRSGKHASEEESAKVDIIEVFNARCLKKEFNDKAAAFALRHNLPGATGSDSHFLFEFGNSYTQLEDLDISDLSDPKTLLRSLKNKKTKLVTRPAPIYVRGTTKMVYFGKKIARIFGI